MAADQVNAAAHRMTLEQETREGRLTGWSHAWCSCDEFDMRGRAVDVAAEMLSHQYSVIRGARCGPNL